MINAQCTLCNLGVGEVPDGLSQRQLAVKYGIAHSSVQRHLKHWALPEPGEEAPSSAVLDNLVERYGVERAALKVRGMTVKDESGSWVRVVTDQEEPEHLVYDDLKHIFEAPAPVPPKTGNYRAEVLCVADLQVGKCDYHGGTPELIERVRRSVAAFAERCKASKPDTIIIADGGDPIENVNNVPAQAHTNDLDVPAQIRTFRRLMADALYEIAPLAPRAVFLSVPSNHGQFRTGLKTPGGTTDADFGLEVNYALGEIFEGREGFEHLEFVRPAPLAETAEVEAAGTKLAWNHGHHSGGPLKHGDWWARQDHGRHPGWDADILVMNHYHTFNVGHSGDGRWIISASSSDNGSAWFSNIKGERALQGMTAFSVADGMWSDLAIL